MPLGSMPEGFTELIAYLSAQPERTYKAAEIQAALQETYSFTSGKVTGIINRATERGVIVKVARSMYKLREAGSPAGQNVLPLCKNEIQASISKIETTVAQKLTESTDEELREVRSILRKLKELAG